jgi:hypothetical protein
LSCNNGTREGEVVVEVVEVRRKDLDPSALLLVLLLAATRVK